MTITEKILNLLELNESLPALVLNEYALVVAKNNLWQKYFGNIENGKTFFNFFDKNTSLLVKNSLLDSKTFQKVKKREIEILVNNETKIYQLLISPFQIKNILYFYIIIYDERHKNNFLIYPTKDDFSYLNKYKNIFELLTENQNDKQVQTDLKYYLDIEREPIAIKDSSDYKMMNNGFNKFLNPEEMGIKLSKIDQVNTGELLLTINSIQHELLDLKSIFIIEKPFANNLNIARSNKMLIFPLEGNDDGNGKILIIGELSYSSEPTIENSGKINLTREHTLSENIVSRDIVDTETEIHDEENHDLNFVDSKIETTEDNNSEINITDTLISNIENTNLNNLGKSVIELSDEQATLIYDKNNFEILAVNNSAAEIYGYDLNELKSMNLIQLFPPEELQKLLLPTEGKSFFEYTQFKKDGTIINIKSERENIIWENQEAYSETIKLIDNISDEEKIVDDANIQEELISEIEENNNIISEEDLAENIELVEEVVENEKEVLEENNKEVVEELDKIIHDETEKVVDQALANRKVADGNIAEEINQTSSNISPFLSSLFHELLTPVNVILGFVQEIIDSLEKPSEEQTESAKIIKENQQLLLQTMNTAVQYAKLEENLLPFNSEKFDLANYLVDLEDSISRVAKNEDVNVFFYKTQDQLVIENDRQKLLASISYFIKFVIKIAKSENVYINFETVDGNLNILVKDSETGISEKVASEILEIYTKKQTAENKNIGISSVTIKLAQKLNEICSAKVIKQIGEFGSDSLALVFPLTNKNIAPKPNQTIYDETDYDKIKSSLNNKKVFPSQELIDETSDVEKVIEKSSASIAEDDNSVTKNDKIKLEEPIIVDEVNDVIVEDISEDEEITTEEIATIEEEIPAKNFDHSALSCLFIDDSVDAQLLFKSQMNDLKMLKVCSNLTEALPLLTKYQFDVIVVDINLNDKYNGLDALKIIRQFANYTSTPIIAVTAYSFEGDKDKFLSFGFTDYFVKPLLKEQILESLSKILS
ncbi:MAG: response regulator [Ignavibacteriae bacterium]|nr:response regulator [Ignavibacteriota bacterium]